VEGMGTGEEMGGVRKEMEEKEERGKEGREGSPTDFYVD